MERLDLAIDALLVLIMRHFGIIVGPVPAADIRAFVPSSLVTMGLNEAEFCELFWTSAQIVVNRVLESTGHDPLGAEAMHMLFLLWRFEFRRIGAF